MTLVKGTIGLGIRERQPIADLSVYKSEPLKNWLNELPMANLGETSRQVYHQLLDSNTHLLSVDVRSTFLATIEETVAFICKSLKKHYTGQSISLTDKQKKIAKLCQAIQIEVSIGYKTIIEDLLNDEKYDSKLLPIAVNHCLYYFHAVQNRSYQLYNDLPHGLWHEIHLLYQLAEQNQFHETKINFAKKSLTAATTYKKILLLATTNPNQLRQRDIDSITNALAIISRHCSISSDPEADYDFVTNLNADAPPFHRALIKDGMKAHYRGINVSNIVELLQEELKTTDTNKRKTQIDNSTLRHLLRAWGTMATRVFSRTPHTGSIQVSVGLAASHYLIQNELFGNLEDDVQMETGEHMVESLEGSLKDAVILNDEDSSIYDVPKASHPSWNTKKNGPLIKSDHMWDTVYRKKASLDMVDDSKPFKFMDNSQSSHNPQYKYQEATIINVSPGGYCIKLDGLLPKQTQTGEIIGLLELNDDGKHTWNIGNIRWMKRHKVGDLQLGVQLIAPNGVPVLGQMRNSHSDSHSYQRCLLLPALVGIGQPPTILTSTIPFAINHKVRLKGADDTFDIRLTKLVSSGHSYQQFEYEKLIADPIKQEEILTPEKFDTVWELL